MATFYNSVQAAALATLALAAGPATYGADLYRGKKLRYMVVDYTIPATGGAVPISGDSVVLCKLPKGAILSPAHSHVWNELVHTALTLNIGDDGVTASANRYAAALNVAAANALVAFASGTIPAAQKTPYQTLLETTVSAVFTGTVTLNTSASQLRFTIGYWLNS